MDRFVVLELGQVSDLSRECLSVNLTVRDAGRLLKGERAVLPPCPELIALNHHWRSQFGQLGEQRIRSMRVKIKAGASSALEQFYPDRDVQFQTWQTECQRLERELEVLLNQWLNAEFFKPVLMALRETVLPRNRAQILLKTDSLQVKQLPWSLWRWLRQGDRQVEVVLGTHDFDKPQLVRRSSLQVQVIIGDGEQIHPEQDLQFLQDQLPGEAILLEPLIQPTRQQVSDRLHNDDVDILFFAGHSETEGEVGVIHINAYESLSISDLTFALKDAHRKGLKLAIFNSCDGLGLVNEIERQGLNLANVLVMQHIISDQVAHQFLRELLTAFAQNGLPLHLAVQRARESLQALENQLPCASRLPMLFQNPAIAETPQFWKDWLLPTRKKSKLWQVLTLSFVVTALILGIRSLGWLESSELWAYDYLNYQRLQYYPEQIDDRIVVVEITPQDVDEYGHPLTDARVVELVKKLDQYHPAVIGLDFYREEPREPGHEQLINLFQQKPNFIGVCMQPFDDRDTQGIAAPKDLNPEQLEHNFGFGNVLKESSNNLVRRQLLSFPVEPSAVYSCKTPYALSVQLASRFLQSNGVHVSVDADNLPFQFGSFVPQLLTKRYGGYQRLDGLNNQILLNYRSQLQPAHTITLSDVLEGRGNLQLVRNRIVLIGVTAPIAKDEWQTPIGKMRGLWLHVHMISQILSASEENTKHPPIWVLPQLGGFQWGDLFGMWVWSAVGGWSALFSQRKAVFFLANVFIIWLLHRVCLLILVKAGWMPLIPSLIALIVTEIAIIAYTVPRRQR